MDYSIDSPDAVGFRVQLCGAGRGPGGSLSIVREGLSCATVGIERFGLNGWG